MVGQYKLSLSMPRDFEVFIMWQVSVRGKGGETRMGAVRGLLLGYGERGLRAPYGGLSGTTVKG